MKIRFTVFWSKIICPKDIYSAGRQTLSQETFGRQKFDMQIFGQQAPVKLFQLIFGQQTFGRHIFGYQTIGEL
jgi:hypothetical protein